MARSKYVYVVRRKHSGRNTQEEHLEVHGTFTVKWEAHRSVSQDFGERLSTIELVRYHDGCFSEGEVIPWDMDEIAKYRP